MDTAAPAHALRAACEQADRILLTGPMFPDGDSIGACLALARGIRHLWPDKTVDVVGDVSFRYTWMPGADAIRPDNSLYDAAPYDLAVVLDGDRTRLTESRTAPNGVSSLSNLLTKHVLGGTETFEDELEQGIQQTLQRIKAEAGVRAA